MSETETPPAPTTTPTEPTSLVNQATPTPELGTDGKPIEAKQAEAAPKAEPLTETSYTIPEGFQADPTDIKDFTTLANELGLSKEGADKLIAFQANLAKKGSEAATQLMQDTWKGWENEVRADKEIGGQNLEPALGRIGKLMSTHGSNELRQILDLTGAGNNIHVIKFFDKIAKEVNEATPVQGAPAAPAARDLASKLYPNQGKA